MAQREEAEALYEQARARSAAAAVDFETTLAARREASALEFAAQVTAAEQQLAAVRLRWEQTRSDSERAQHDAATKIAQQLEQATARAQGLVAEAKTKAERIRDNSERELAAATQRRDSINAQLSSVRHELAEVGAARINPMLVEEPAADRDEAALLVEQVVGEQEVIAELEADIQAAAEVRRSARIEVSAGRRCSLSWGIKRAYTSGHGDAVMIALSWRTSNRTRNRCASPSSRDPPIRLCAAVRAECCSPTGSRTGLPAPRRPRRVHLALIDDQHTEEVKEPLTPEGLTASRASTGLSGDRRAHRDRAQPGVSQTSVPGT
jgi:hypothetical protein